MKNEQELREQFEHEAWCDTQNNISKICNCMIGYPLEVIENLQETIKDKDAEIEIHWEVRNKQSTAIAEARELVSKLLDRAEIDNDYDDYEKAKAWLEANKAGGR